MYDVTPYIYNLCEAQGTWFGFPVDRDLHPDLPFATGFAGVGNLRSPLCSSPSVKLGPRRAANFTGLILGCSQQ